MAWKTGKTRVYGEPVDYNTCAPRRMPPPTDARRWPTATGQRAHPPPYAGHLSRTCRVHLLVRIQAGNMQGGVQAGRMQGGIHAGRRPCRAASMQGACRAASMQGTCRAASMQGACRAASRRGGIHAGRRRLSVERRRRQRETKRTRTTPRTTPRTRRRTYREEDAEEDDAAGEHHPYAASSRERESAGRPGGATTTPAVSAAAAAAAAAAGDLVGAALVVCGRRRAGRHHVGRRRYRAVPTPGRRRGAATDLAGRPLTHHGPPPRGQRLRRSWPRGQVPARALRPRRRAGGQRHGAQVRWRVAGCRRCAHRPLRRLTCPEDSTGGGTLAAGCGTGTPSTKSTSSASGSGCAPLARPTSMSPSGHGGTGGHATGPGTKHRQRR